MIWLLSSFLLTFTCTGVALARLQRPRLPRKVKHRLETIRRSLVVAEEGNDVLEAVQVEARNDIWLRRMSLHAESAWIVALLRESACGWSVVRFLTTILSGMVLSGAVEALAGLDVWFIVPSMAAGGLLPLAFLRWKRSRRLRALNEVLPSTIDLMSRALQAGHSVQQMIEVASEQAPEPLRSELAAVWQELRLGLPLREALLAMLTRVPSQDLRFVVTAILLQKQTGGDLIVILDRTTAVIRERLRVQGEVKTCTAQGRFAGIVLTVLPIALFGVTMLLTPAYASLLLSDPVGHKLLEAAGGMLILGGFFMRQATKVEI